MIEFKTDAHGITCAKFAGSGADIIVEIATMISLLYSQLYSRGGEKIARGFRLALASFVNDPDSPCWDLSTFCVTDSIYAEGAAAKVLLNLERTGQEAKHDED